MLDNKQPLAGKGPNQPATGKAAVTRRTAVKRLGMVAAAGALVAGASPALALADNDNRKDSSTNRKPSGFNVLLVHGAFADASTWNEVIPLLQKEGHKALAVQLPLTGLVEDVAVARQALASLSGPTVVVAHSYGGAVITGAATGAANAIGLVYATAYVPMEGESVGFLNSKFPPPLLVSHLIPAYRNGFVYIDPAFFPQVFALDADQTLVRAMGAGQNPTSLNCLNDVSGPPAWKNLPAWYLVSKKDNTINPDLERYMASRIKANTIEVNSSHASPISHSCEVAGLIEAAIKQYQKKH